MTLFHTDLQNLGQGSEDCFTAVMSIDQSLHQQEAGYIKYNLLMITNERNTNNQQLRRLSANINGGSLKYESQQRRGASSMSDHKSLQAETTSWEKDKASLTKRLKAMEQSGVKRNQVRGQNHLKKTNWEHTDYMNDDNIIKFCQLTVYPHYKILPMGWDRYSGNHPKTLCYKVINVIRVPNGIKKEWYWFNRVVPIMNKKFIDMRSNTRGACRKQYTSEIEIQCVT